MLGRAFMRVAGVLLAVQLAWARARADAPAAGDAIGGLLAALAGGDFARAQAVAGGLDVRGRSLAQTFGADLLAPLAEALTARSSVRAVDAAARFAVTDIRGQLRTGLALDHDDAVKQAATAAFAAYTTLARYLPADLFERDREIKRLFHALLQALSTAGSGTPATVRAASFGAELDDRLATLLPGLGSPVTEVAASRQATVLLRALAYDMNLVARAGEALVILVLYNPADPASARAADDMTSAFKAFEATTVQGRRVSVRRLAFAGAPTLRTEMAALKIGALYLCPALDADLAAIEAVSREAKVRTLASRGRYLDRGIALGVFETAGRISVTVNLTASRLEGAAFSPDLLRLAHVMP
jgi:hypothetical protein